MFPYKNILCKHCLANDKQVVVRTASNFVKKFNGATQKYEIVPCCDEHVKMYFKDGGNE